MLKGVGSSGGELHPAADFELVYERFRLPIYRFVRGMVLDAEMAEEVTRQAFDRAYSARDRYEHDLSVAAWLHAFAVRLSMSHLRRRRLARFLGRPPAAAAEDSEKGEDPSGVEIALAALSPGLRAVALLVLYAHLSTEDAAAILGTSEQAVSSRLRAAIEGMTAALSTGRRAQATGPR